mmetsp:Transcript_9500/g.13970  ORF Transcript_9500/g.13970 Transcript_9500/m.13970 type:complete len:93 (-) Transcript_9500:613-891(-)
MKDKYHLKYVTRAKWHSWGTAVKHVLGAKDEGAVKFVQVSMDRKSAMPRTILGWVQVRQHIHWRSYGPLKAGANGFMDGVRRSLGGGIFRNE